MTREEAMRKAFEDKAIELVSKTFEDYYWNDDSSEKDLSNLEVKIAKELLNAYQLGQNAQVELPTDEEFKEMLVKLGKTKEKGYSTIHFLDFWDILFELRDRLTSSQSAKKDDGK